MKPNVDQIKNANRIRSESSPATCRMQGWVQGFKFYEVSWNVLRRFQSRPVTTLNASDPNQECVQPDPEVSATCQCKSGFTTVTVKGITACIRDICSVADLNCGCKAGSKQPILDDNGNEVGCECQCNEGWKETNVQ